MGLHSEHHRSRPGRLALSVWRSVLSTAPSLGSQLEDAVGRVCITNSSVVWRALRALAGTTVRYHCGHSSQIIVGLSRQIDN